MYTFQLVSSCGSHFPLLGGELMRFSITSQRKREGESNLMETDEVMPVQGHIIARAHRAMMQTLLPPKTWQGSPASQSTAEAVLPVLREDAPPAHRECRARLCRWLFPLVPPPPFRSYRPFVHPQRSPWIFDSLTACH